jgi:hypothetical protein
MQAINTLPKLAFTPLKQFIYIFVLTVASQAFHMVEHIAQVMQKFVFHVIPILPDGAMHWTACPEFIQGCHHTRRSQIELVLLLLMG